MEKFKVLFYLDKSIISKEPKGGPNGVGSMYYKEMQKRGEFIFDFIENDNPTVISGTKTLVRKLPNWINNIQREIRKRQMVIDLLTKKPKETGICFDKYDIIFFHQAYDMYIERDKLKTYKGIVILQSHCPEPQSHEMYALQSSFVKKTIPNLLKRYEKIDEYAFERADYLIFPCEEAEEPYFKCWDYFKELHTRKKDRIKFLLTGIVPAIAKRNRFKVLDELNIPQDSFVISYVGRHNSVKGYDILKNIASTYLQCDEGSWFVIAGKEYPLTRLNHPRWKEIGWTTDAHSYIKASDVFVLPNRETYFDLVMLEILSLGKIVVASRTGGNRYFENKGVKGVFLYDNEEEAISLLKTIKAMTKEERNELEQANIQFFQENCQASSMYDSCSSVLENIWEEYTKY